MESPLLSCWKVLIGGFVCQYGVLFPMTRPTQTWRYQEVPDPKGTRRYQTRRYQTWRYQTLKVPDPKGTRP